MANNIYIGARYVPLFVGDWNDQTVYEPLSVVNYNNGTYTSKKTVPAGILPTNTEYWALTGNYNAQVEEYRQEVVALGQDVDALDTTVEGLGTTVEGLGTTVEGLDDRVTDLEENPPEVDFFKSRLEGKKLILVGDSLVAADNVNGLNYWLEQTYGMSVTVYGYNGAPIGGNGSNSLYARIDNIIAQTPASTVDYFLVLGGANDKNNSLPIGFYADRASGSGTFSASVVNLFRKLSAAYPQKFIGGITTPHRYDTQNSLELNERDYAGAMIESCGFVGVPCFDAYDNAGFNLIESDNYYTWADRGYVTSGTADHHPSSAAYKIWADKIAAFLVSSDSNYLRSVEVTKFEDENGFSGQMLKFAGGLKMMFIRYTPANRFVCTTQLTDGRYATDDISFAFSKDYFTFVSGAIATPHGAANSNLGVIANGYTAANNAGTYRVTSDHSGTFNGHLSVIVFGY